MKAEFNNALEKLSNAITVSPQVGMISQEQFEEKMRNALIDTVLKYELESPTTKDKTIGLFLEFVQQVVRMQSKKEQYSEKPSTDSIVKAKDVLGELITKPEYKNKDVKTISYIARGLLHLETKDFKKALNDFNLVLTNLTDTLPKKGRCECMKRYYRDCILGDGDIAFVEDNWWTWWLIVIVQTYRGNVYYEQQDYKKAYDLYCVPARMLSKQSDYRKYIDHPKILKGWILIRCYAQKGKALIELGNLPEALKWLFMALKEITIDEGQAAPQPANSINGINDIIEYFDDLKTLNTRINKIEVWEKLDEMLNNTTPKEFFSNGHTKYNKHKSDYINKVAYCLYLLRVDGHKDKMLDWIEAAVKFDENNLFAHFNKLLYYGIKKKNIDDKMKLKIYKLLNNRRVLNSKHADRILAVTALLGFAEKLPQRDKLRNDVFLKLMHNFDNIISAPSKFYDNILKEKIVDEKLGSRVVVLRRWNERGRDEPAECHDYVHA